MKCTKRHIDIQQSPVGDVKQLTVYELTGTVSGPRIYLQANLHGPEIFGTTLLGRLITELQSRDLPGIVTIVPCANPIGVQMTAYNAMTGRFHIQTGQNWNRIFSEGLRFASYEHEQTYFRSMRTGQHLSVVEKLAAELKLLSSGADVVLDIHTSGSKNEPHIFTHEMCSSFFSSLGANVHILWDRAHDIGAFDESHVLPFLDTLPVEKLTSAATWEVSAHTETDGGMQDVQYDRLRTFVEAVLMRSVRSSSTQIDVPLARATHLYSSLGGYLTWRISVGDMVGEGEIYAWMYQPHSGETIALSSDRSFILLSEYGVKAAASGEPIAWVVYPL